MTTLEAPSSPTGDQPGKSVGDRLEMPISPAPSPIPSVRHLRRTSGSFLRNDSPEMDIHSIQKLFFGLDDANKLECLRGILTNCSHDVLVDLEGLISPLLRHDPFKVLPYEISLRILSYIKDPKTLAAASQVSRLWYLVLSDDYTWKELCKDHHFRRLSAAGNEMARSFISQRISNAMIDEENQMALDSAVIGSPQPKEMSLAASKVGNLVDMHFDPDATEYVKPTTYRSHFRQQYLISSAWEDGGRLAARYVIKNTEDVIVTDLIMQDDYIVISMDNSRILVFGMDGRLLSSLCGHVMGVWALALHGHTLVSGGCDRSVRAWDLKTMQATYIMNGHTSTVRCLAMAGPTTALSGSRDSTVRVWNLTNGVCERVLEGHTSAVRCLKTSGDFAVSASYDNTASVWRISTGEQLHVLQGHHAQIYSLAVDGMKAATGGADASIFLWDIASGRCLGVLSGHLALVGQLQLRGNVLVSASSDGAMRVWDFSRLTCRHRIIAHDNAVTSLQFDDERILSGGPDGKIQVFDTATGKQQRTLGSSFSTIWGLRFKNDRLVVVGSEGRNTVFEMLSFVPS